MLGVMKKGGDFCHACFSGNYPVEPPGNKNKYQLEGKNRQV
jgi:glutamine phosphoribosylpyrophosphate amidotransferase